MGWPDPRPRLELDHREPIEPLDSDDTPISTLPDEERPPPVETRPPATVQGLLLDSPALGNPKWLPETEWDDLEALRANHLRLLDLRTEASTAVAELRRTFKEEDKERDRLLREAYRDGADSVEIEVTPPEERRAKLEAAERKAKAVGNALGDFLSEAVETIEARTDDWLNDLADAASEAERKRAEAARLLREAEAVSGQHRKLEAWLLRTAGRHQTFKRTSARHFPFADLPTPPPPDAGRLADPQLDSALSA